jgi:hypothetical protein
MNAQCKDSKKRAIGPFKGNLRPKTAWLNEASNIAVPMAKPRRRLTARSLNSQSNQKATDQAQVLERVLHSPNTARAECTAPNLLAGIHLVACTVNRQHSTTQLLHCLAKIQREACLVSNRTCSEEALEASAWVECPAWEAWAEWAACPEWVDWVACPVWEAECQAWDNPAARLPTSSNSKQPQRNNKKNSKRKIKVMEAAGLVVSVDSAIDCLNLI